MRLRYKIFIFAADVEQLEKLGDELRENPAVAVASSFIYNQEVTAVEAQKGPVLKEYIEALGYTMDEVMVLGDSLNDYSMISMDFGATVAMENAVPEIKRQQNTSQRATMSLVWLMLSIRFWNIRENSFTPFEKVSYIL